MNATLTRISCARRALALRIAEQELDWMEHHGPAAIERQRACVLKLRNAADKRTSDDVRRDVERRAKQIS